MFNFKVRGKLLSLVIISILLFSVAINIVVYFKFNSFVTNSYLKTNAELSLQLINEKYPGDWSSKDGKLYKGTKLVNDDNEIVDLIKRTSNVECTIFSQDTRVATTIQNDGKRIVGTKSDPKVLDSVLNKRDTYTGLLEVAGTKYDVIYVPISDNKGSAIGMFFVGVETKVIVKQINSISIDIMLLTLILIVVISLLLTFLIIKIIIKPINYTKKCLQAVGDCDLSIEISPKYLTKKDEFGDMVKSLKKMQDSLRLTIGKVKENSENIDDGAHKLSSRSCEISTSSQTVITVVENAARGIESQSLDLLHINERLDDFSKKLSVILINSIEKIIESWACKDGRVYTTEEILNWVEERNTTVNVNIRKINPDEDSVWKYIPEEGIIANPSKSFFTITGYKNSIIEQPIIIQNEIGYLGILCKEIDGVVHFLMQAKIEPGNVNKVQLSPTIQATKSNFTQKHGGTKTPYIDFFLKAEKYEIIVDQIQSEQSARFRGKRNRNIVILLSDNEKIEILQSHRWMTLGQIKELMKYDNLVNMDSRTVIACLPISFADKENCKKYFNNLPLYNSIFNGDEINHLPSIFRYINNRRMFDEDKGELVPLENLKNWSWKNGEFINTQGYHFKIIFCDISIEGREVKKWTQPLFEAVGMATFGLICCEEDGILKFLVKAREEVGSFDGPELGPTVQLEADEKPSDNIEKMFLEEYLKKSVVLHDVIMSEEGGRFYHEQNRNIIITVDKKNIPKLAEGYFLVDYKTLNMLVQVNNCLNIQLRNLLSLLEV